MLECYNSGTRNVFALGFVPLKDENTGGWLAGWAGDCDLMHACAGVFALGFVPLKDENTGGWVALGCGVLGGGCVSGVPPVAAGVQQQRQECGSSGRGAAAAAAPCRLTAPPPRRPCACLAVVLLARDTPPAAPGIRDLAIDMGQWQPLVEDRAFVPWLVKVRGCSMQAACACA